MTNDLTVITDAPANAKPAKNVKRSYYALFADGSVKSIYDTTREVGAVWRQDGGWPGWGFAKNAKAAAAQMREARRYTSAPAGEITTDVHPINER